jgi:hypothetical protein
MWSFSLIQLGNRLIRYCRCETRLCILLLQVLLCFYSMRECRTWTQSSSLRWKQDFGGEVCTGINLMSLADPKFIFPWEDEMIAFLEYSENTYPAHEGQEWVWASQCWTQPSSHVCTCSHPQNLPTQADGTLSWQWPEQLQLSVEVGVILTEAHWHCW